MHRTNLSILLIFFLSKVSAKSDTFSDLYQISVTVRECLSNQYPGACLKERALEALNETMFLDEPVMIGYIRVEKNSNYNWNSIKDKTLPDEISKRSMVLNDALYDKIQQYFKSRTIKLNVDEAIEGRKKGGGGKGKGAIMMVAACVGAGMMMGKMGMMAMTAMMMSKIALLIPIMMMMLKKKDDGGDGGKEKEIKIIYATTGGGGGDYGKGGGGGGGGGGGWHRSISHEPQTITYRAHIPEDANTNVIYEGTTKCKEETAHGEQHELVQRT